jgi:hypothetical protein
MWLNFMRVPLLEWCPLRSSVRVGQVDRAGVSPDESGADRDEPEAQRLTGAPAATPVGDPSLGGLLVLMSELAVPKQLRLVVAREGAQNFGVHGTPP